MITAEIMGGLGNQMHIIFTLISYSLTNKVAFYFENKVPDMGSRKVVYWENMFKNFARFLKQPVKEQARIKEKNINYTPLPKPLPNTRIKLFGYFQSPKYYDNQKENILRLMKFNEICQEYKDIYNYENIISLHFRLGDYKSLQDYHPIMPITYYEEGLKNVISNTNNDNWQVLYFCEDEDIEYIECQIEYLKEKIPTVTFLRALSSLHDWEQMIVMSLCKHNIIANSTFSWWSAYLNCNEDKIVICPSTLHGKKANLTINLEDRYPDSWTILNVNI